MLEADERIGMWEGRSGREVSLGEETDFGVLVDLLHCLFHLSAAIRANR